MYICLHCGHGFDEPTNRYNRRWSDSDDSEPCCPNCGSEDIEEGMVCRICGEVHREEDMIGQVCKDCLDKSVTFGNALRYGKERKQDVELNEFLTWCYSPDEIESILLKNLQECSHEWRQRMANEYCTDDKYDFADFLEEKGVEE
jgi:DNA-directed RNA polymerase subunit RPC12/RpoP